MRSNGKKNPPSPITEKALGPDHANVAAAVNRLAQGYMFQGDYAQAGVLYLRSLAILTRTLDRGHPDVVATRESHAAALKKLRQDAEIRRLESEANELAGRKQPRK